MKKLFLFFLLGVSCQLSYGQIYTPSSTIQGATTGTLSSTAVGIGTNNPQSILNVQNGCVLFDGTTGSTPVTGAGTRFMWIPEKKAFRAGEVTGNQWDNLNIGSHSGAGGYNTRAEHEGSFAWGMGAFAVNDPNAMVNEACISLGANTTASGHVSIALGDQAWADGGGGATAIGVATRADGVSAIAIGQNTQASGVRSIALGELALSTGNKSVAVGQDAQSSGTSSLSLSTDGAIASGNHSIAMGAKADNNSYQGAFVYADYDPTFSLPTVQNTNDFQFKTRAIGGYEFHTDGNLSTNEAMYFLSGMLGVGTDLPTEKADVNGKMRVRDIPQDNSLNEVLVKDIDGILHYRDASTLRDEDWLTVTNTNPTSVNDDIYTNGKVGIGTNAPNGQVHAINPTCTGKPGLQVSAMPSTGPCNNIGNGNLFQADGYDYTGAVVPKFIINSIGQVGIGTTNPLYSLELKKVANPSSISNTYGFLSDVKGNLNGDVWGAKINAIEGVETYGLDVFANGTSDNSTNTYAINSKVQASRGNTHGLKIDVTNSSASSVNNYGIRTDATALGSSNVVNFGIYANIGSVGSAASYAGYFKASNTTNAAFFNGTVVTVGGTTTISDRKFKKDVNGVEDALESIMEMKPSTYKFHEQDKFPSFNFPEEKQYGFIAQELESVVPELVKDGINPAQFDKEGNKIGDEVKFKSVNYTAIIPILTAGIQEQQAIIESQNEKIQLLEERLNKLEAESTGINIDNRIAEGVELYQNVPNPFRGYTSIDYRLPDNATNAQIKIFDMNGKHIKNVQLEGTGEGKVNISADELSAGMYLYSLIINGAEVATKRMVIE